MSYNCVFQYLKKKTISAVLMQCFCVSEFVVCGDEEGNMWFNQHPDVSSWSDRKPVRSSPKSHLIQNYSHHRPDTMTATHFTVLYCKH